MKKVLLVILTLSLAACLNTNAAIQQPATNTPTPQATATDSPTATNEPTVCTVTAGSLHIRSGPGLSYPVIGYLFAGDIVTIEGTRGNWYEIGTGFIHSKYCERK